MPDYDIPGFGLLSLAHLVLDFNGTLALDGELLPGVSERLAELARRLNIHIITADTFGTVAGIFRYTGYDVHVIGKGGEGAAKAAYVRELGTESCACVGNGRNDVPMLGEAALGMAVLQEEGAASAALAAADIVAPDINAALDLLLRPKRLIATLRE